MIGIEEIGFTKEELQQRVVDCLVEQILDGALFSDSGDPDPRFKKLLDEKIKTAIDENVAAVAKEHVEPCVEEIVRGFVFQETSGWGEKRGESFTLTEYLVRRAGEYLREEVDENGRTRDECIKHRNSFYSRGPRFMTMVTGLFDLSIKEAMREAVKNANEHLVGGIEGAVKEKLAEISKALKISVSTGR